MRYLFNKQRFLTIGINKYVSKEIQAYIWKCIDDLIKEYKTIDYLQVFTFQKQDNLLIMIHQAESPKYYKIHYLKYQSKYEPLLDNKIYVIDDRTHITMLFAYEY